MKRSIYKSFHIWKRFLNDGAKEQSSNWIQPNGFMTDVNVYNPLTKCKVPLILKNKGFVSWYMCGPTVYDSAHLGHACTFVRFDAIRRILSNFFDINVISVMGITDIDDKIIRRSLETKQEWRQLAKFYEQEFIEETRLLNILPPYLYCRVTDYIPQIVQFVERILAMDAAYIGKDGSVYFDTAKWKQYGKLKKPPASETHLIKRSTTDFVLWKASKPGEPYWESPWGPGRPGWHIECSAMARIFCAARYTIITKPEISGANVNATSPIIGSPLHVACADNIPNRLQILCMLLERGADPNLVIRSDEGPALRPVLAEYVASNVNPSVEIVALLLKYGARVVIKTQYRDPHGILNSLQNTANKPMLLRTLLAAAESFDPCMIRRSSSLTDAQRALVMEAARKPLPLTHQARLIVRKMCGTKLPKVVRRLQLPESLHRYLLYDLY